MQLHFEKRWFAYLLLGLGFGLLVFFRLDRFSLWQDEADQAMRALSILQHGVPLALVDGKFVTQWNGQESTTRYLWFFNPWLSSYLNALGFKIFGISDWAARFPFALVGFFSLIPLGLVAWNWTKNHFVTFLTLFFFATNVWVILHLRQARYFSLTFFAYGLLLLGYQKWEENKRGGLLFALGMILLFHDNYFILVLSLLGFFLNTLFFANEPQIRRRFFITVLLTIGIFCLPFFLVGSFENRVTMLSNLPNLPGYFKKLGTHLFYFNAQVCPLLLIFFGFFWWRRSHTLRFIFLSISSAWLGIGLLNFDVLRYNLQLIPLFCFLMAATVVQFYQKNRALGFLIFLILWGTNIFQKLPETVWQIGTNPNSLSFKENILKEEWWALKNYYFKEYLDPPRVIPQLLQRHLKPGEHVFLVYNQTVWEFYSDIPLAYFVLPELAPPKDPPLRKEWTNPSFIDWWVGPNLVKLPKGPFLSQEEMIEIWRRQGFGYERIDTKIPVLNWDLNSPIRYKHFLERFSDKPIPSETIQLLHRI